MELVKELPEIFEEFAKCNTYRKIFQLKNSQTFTP